MEESSSVSSSSVVVLTNTKAGSAVSSLATSSRTSLLSSSLNKDVENEGKAVVAAAAEEEVIDISKDKHIFYAIVFVLCGNASLYFWNALLNCVFDVIDQQYPEYPNMSDTLTAVNNTLCFAVAVVVLFFGGSVHRWMMYAGYTLLALSSIGFCLIVQYCEGHTGFILHHVLQIFGGIGAGLAESGSFSFACIMPHIYAGWVSFGMGISGILSFAFYMLFSEVCFPRQVVNDVWANLSISCALSVAALVILVFYFKDPLAHKCIDNVQQQKKSNAIRDDNEKPISYWEAFKSTWVMQWNTFLVMWLTLFLFPNVGPLAWADDPTQTNTVMGMFQLGDFCGRYIPNAATFLPMVMISEKWLPWLTLVRLIFIAVFVLAKEYTTGIMGNFGVHIVLMLTLAITNGWYVTLSLIYIPRTLKKQQDRNQAAAIGTISLLFGIMSGLWMAKIFTLF